MISLSTECGRYVCIFAVACSSQVARARLRFAFACPAHPATLPGVRLRLSFLLLLGAGVGGSVEVPPPAASARRLPSIPRADSLGEFPTFALWRGFSHFGTSVAVPSGKRRVGACISLFIIGTWGPRKALSAMAASLTVNVEVLSQ